MSLDELANLPYRIGDFALKIIGDPPEWMDLLGAWTILAIFTFLGFMVTLAVVMLFLLMFEEPIRWAKNKLWPKEPPSGTQDCSGRW